MNRLFDIQYPTKILNVEQALKCCTNSLAAIIDKHAPFKKLGDKDTSNPWFSSEPSVMLNTRDETWALARRSGEEAHCLTFRQLK